VTDAIEERVVHNSLAIRSKAIYLFYASVPAADTGCKDE
jgi:hypothetical protein